MGAIEEIEQQIAEEKPVRGKPGPKPKAAPAEELAAVVEEALDFTGVTLGETVLYVTPIGTIRPAIVTKINPDSNTVDLTVFNSQGAAPATEVPYEDGDELIEHSFHAR